MSSIATVAVLRPIRVPAGGHLDGVTLASPAWAMGGEHTILTDAARQAEADGYCEILSVDGRREVWTACCAGGEHSHD